MTCAAAANVQACPAYKTLVRSSTFLLVLRRSRASPLRPDPHRVRIDAGVVPIPAILSPTVGEESRLILVPDDKSKTRRVNSSEQIARRLNGDGEHNV